MPGERQTALSDPSGWARARLELCAGVCRPFSTRVSKLLMAGTSPTENGFGPEMPRYSKRRVTSVVVLAWGQGVARRVPPGC